jgi:hypothetical protein
VSEPSEAEAGVQARPDPLEPLAAEREPSEPQPVAMPEEPVAAPDQVHLLKRWTFVLVLLAVWIPAAAIGLGLYYWWFHSVDKTWPVFVVLIFLAVCTVGALLTAMVDGRPLVAAVAVAMMAAPLAAVAGAAVLHGTYFCNHVSRCLVGLIPY